jgi:hypothetical protein
MADDETNKNGEWNAPYLSEADLRMPDRVTGRTAVDGRYAPVREALASSASLHLCQMCPTSVLS